MKLTKREIIMLILLGGVLLIFSSYKFLIKPQLDKISVLKEKELQLEETVARSRLEIASYDKVKDNLDMISSQIDEATVSYFPSIKQEKIITVLDDMLGKAQVKGENLVVETIIKNAAGELVAESKTTQRFGDELEQNIAVKNPELWSPETPVLYVAELKLVRDNIKDWMIENAATKPDVLRIIDLFNTNRNTVLSDSDTNRIQHSFTIEKYEPRK